MREGRGMAEMGSGGDEMRLGESEGRGRSEEGVVSLPGRCSILCGAQFLESGDWSTMHSVSRADSRVLGTD